MARNPYRGAYAQEDRSENFNLSECNPQDANAMSNDTGNAGADGYSCLSRANRYNGRRPAIGGEPEYPFPNLAID